VSLQDEDSEYESGSSDDEEGRLAKPVFVAKSNRDTIVERERLEREEEMRLQADQTRKEQRKVCIGPLPTLAHDPIQQSLAHEPIQ
jgi:hypothetical protein